MAIRTIRTEKDEILYKKSREIKEITPRIRELVDDMFETMYHADGVGLAAVQVGVLKRIFVIDIGEGKYVFINPVIVSKEGEQIDVEGCLSFPNIRGNVLRPEKIIVKAYDLNFSEFELEASGFFARAICHEYDHLEGKVFVDKIEEDILTDNNSEEEEDN